MNLTPMARTLSQVTEPEGTMVTLTLDVSKSGVPADARRFLEDRVLRDLRSPDRPAEAREALRKIARRIESFVDRELKPETDGLFLAAGRTTWQPVELRLPLRNSWFVGRTACVAPLLEAQARSPATLLVRANGSGMWIEEFSLGETRERIRLANAKETADREHTMPHSAARDRYRRHQHEASARLLRKAAAEAAKHEEARKILFFGGAAAFNLFRDHLPAGLRARAGRTDGSQAAALVERMALEEHQESLSEFQDRRAHGHLVALGPSEVLDHLAEGTVARLFVDPYDPLPGLACPGCHSRFPGIPRLCTFCGDLLVPTSLTQEVVAHSLAHPQLAVTYVDGPAGWLADLGGMAALLTGRRTVTVG